MESRTDTARREVESSSNFTGGGTSRVSNLLIAQLEAIVPASLPLETLSQGVACGCPDAVDGDVARALQNLLANGLVIKISECGFVDRFRLAEVDGRGLEEDGR